MRGKGKPLNNGERIQILQVLLSYLTACKLHRGTISAVLAVEFGVSRHCVGALWKRGLRCQNPLGLIDTF